MEFRNTARSSGSFAGAALLAFALFVSPDVMALQEPDEGEGSRTESRIIYQPEHQIIEQEVEEDEEEGEGRERVRPGMIPTAPRLDPDRVRVPEIPADFHSTYAEREEAAIRDTDHCGPAWMTDVTGSALDFEFEQVCKRHDACYRLQEQTQRWCDDRMERELNAICDDASWYRWLDCNASAAIYSSFIRTTYGGEAYSGDGAPIPPMGEIVSVERTVTDDWLSDDEVTYCVIVRNPSPITQEYDIELYAGRGNRVDREPDMYEFNVEAGRQTRRCVGTDYSADWSISDLPPRVQILLRADTPVGWDFTGDMVVVDTSVQRGG